MNAKLKAVSDAMRFKQQCDEIQAAVRTADVLAEKTPRKVWVKLVPVREATQLLVQRAADDMNDRIRQYAAETLGMANVVPSDVTLRLAEATVFQQIVNYLGWTDSMSIQWAPRQEAGDRYAEACRLANADGVREGARGDLSQAAWDLFELEAER